MDVDGRACSFALDTDTDGALYARHVGRLARGLIFYFFEGY
jgi:hypothetical protein